MLRLTVLLQILRLSEKFQRSTGTKITWTNSGGMAATTLGIALNTSPAKQKKQLDTYWRKKKATKLVSLGNEDREHPQVQDESNGRYYILI